MEVLSGPSDQMKINLRPRRRALRTNRQDRLSARMILYRTTFNPRSGIAIRVLSHHHLLRSDPLTLYLRMRSPHRCQIRSSRTHRTSPYINSFPRRARTTTTLPNSPLLPPPHHSTLFPRTSPQTSRAHPRRSARWVTIYPGPEPTILGMPRRCRASKRGARRSLFYRSSAWREVAYMKR